jgi:L-proline amide hydrolase
VEEAKRLRKELPPEVQAALLKHEAAGTFDDPEYLAAMQVFYDRHVCRVVPNPEYVTRSFASIAVNPEVYHTMNGPSEFHVIGTLKDWDIIDRLGEIRVPTLVTSGRFDEATPLIAGTVHEGIQGSRWEIFEESSHMPHAEEPERYMAVLDEFLSEVEAARAS